MRDMVMKMIRERKPVVRASDFYVHGELIFACPVMDPAPDSPFRWIWRSQGDCNGIIESFGLRFFLPDSGYSSLALQLAREENPARPRFVDVPGWLACRQRKK